MTKLDIKYELLDLLNEDEINTVCKNTDLNMFLEPIKAKRYDKYSKKLGRLDKKSPLVKKMLPQIAFNLYKKNEEPFKAAIALVLQEYQEKFIQAITDCIDPSLTIDELKAYNSEQIADFYFKLLDASVFEIREDLFYVFVKLQGIEYSSEEKKNIGIKILQKNKERFINEKHQADMADALKKLEKDLVAVHKQKLVELQQQIKEYKTQYEESSSQKKSIQRQLDSLKTQVEYDRRELELEWQEQYEKQLQERNTADEADFRQRREETDKALHEYVAQLDVVAEQRRQGLEVQYQKQLRESQEALISELEPLIKQKQELIDNRNKLESEIEELSRTKEGIETKIKCFKDVEDSYFATFEKRIIEKKIDKLIFDKLGISVAEKEFSTITTHGFSIIESKSFTNETVYGEKIETIEDFLEDYKDNVSINFDNEIEISAAVIAGLLNDMAVIACNPVCNYLAEAFSALVDLGTPIVINIDSRKADAATIVSSILKTESQVILVNGVLDTYDEILFSRLCEVRQRKHLFFSISNLESLQMVSKAVMNMAVIIDAEDYLHFEADESIIIGDHDITPLAPKISAKACQDTMRKVFNRLASNRLMRKATALKYCQFIQRYYELLDANTMGDIVQKATVAACTVNDIDDTRDILTKCGITIFNE